MLVSGWHVMLNKNLRILAILLWTQIGSATLVFAAEQEPPAANSSEDQTAEEMLAAEAALEARESQNADPAAAAADTNGDDAADAPVAADSNPRQADEGFVPTIQISEDLSVSFPVDI